MMQYSPSARVSCIATDWSMLAPAEQTHLRGADGSPLWSTSYPGGDGTALKGWRAGKRGLCAGRRQRPDLPPPRMGLGKFPGTGIDFAPGSPLVVCPLSGRASSCS